MRFDLTPNAAETPELLADRFAAEVRATIKTESNLRGSAEYRQPSGRSSGQSVRSASWKGNGKETTMQITIILNGTRVSAEAAPDTLLIDFVRSHGCYSVKRGCETANCGLCTVFLDDKPVLSCSVLAARADGHRVTTLEGLQDEAAEFGAFIADQGAEQCGFCNPGFIMNALALFREKEYPTEDEIKEYLAGNLCRCSGYEGQLRGIQAFLAWKRSKEAAE